MLNQHLNRQHLPARPEPHPLSGFQIHAQINRQALRTIDSECNEFKRLQLNCSLLALCCQMLSRQASADQEAVFYFFLAQATIDKLEPIAELLHWTWLHPMIGFYGSIICDQD